jgi:diguanylate cyclase (GGDEF)-like protein
LAKLTKEKLLPLRKSLAHSPKHEPAIALARLCPVLCSVLCLLLLASLGSAQCLALEVPADITQYVQTSLTDKSGLPQNSVNTITQTRDGYLWFGTEEGLARFDGLHVTVFDTIRYKALTDNYIQTIVAGRDGSLWIGSRSGLIRYKDGVFETFLTASSPISTIFEAEDNRLWVGTAEGLYAVDGHNAHHFTTANGLPDNGITSIVQASDGKLWVGTRKGIASLENGAFHPVSLSAGHILALAACPEGSLWVATDLGLFRWKGKLLETIPSASLPPRAHIISLYEDRDSTLWIGFSHSGIASLRYGKIKRYASAEGLPSDDVSTVFEDREGHLWIGMFEAGVVELRDGSFSTFGKREGLSQDMVWSVLQARDKSIWVGTDSKGLNHIEKNGMVHVYTTHDGLSVNTIYGLFESPDQSLWIGTDDGALNHLRNGHVTVFRDPAFKGVRLAAIVQAPSSQLSSSPDSSPDLLLGFHQVNGLARFHHGAFQHYTVPGLINTVTTAPDGSVWVGTDHGGVSRIVNGSVTDTYTTQNGLLSNFAQAVYVDREGVVWAGTSPGGLNRIKNGHITTYSIDQGLFDLTVGAIVEDDSGYLWMTCNKGIYKVSKKELNDYADGLIPAIHSIVYGNADGLRSIECNFAAIPSVWKGDGGRLWFATTAGIASVDPNHSQIRTRAPSLLIEHVLFNQKSLPLAQQVSAGPGSGDLEIQFTAPDFVAPQRIHFRYRLRGSDTTWVDAGERRQAFYTKLSPGHYVFEVQDAIGDRNWGPGQAQLEIELIPHFWQTDLFRGLCILLFVFLCAAVFWLRVRYLVEHNRELEERVNQRTAELQQAMRVSEAAHRALHEQATRDSLTGLWNRRSIFEMLGNEILRAQRDNLSIAVVMVDVDHFKLVNDTHGHLTGDSVLQEVAKRIGELTRSYDFAGRYGGEEFVIVLPGCSLSDALSRAEEFRAAVADASIPVASGSLQITCSFGVAVCFHNVHAEQLIHKADEALYSAKRAGRNCVHSCPQPLQSRPKVEEFSTSVL